jgi:hypothetical protein
MSQSQPQASPDARRSPKPGDVVIYYEGIDVSRNSSGVNPGLIFDSPAIISSVGSCPARPGEVTLIVFNTKICRTEYRIRAQYSPEPKQWCWSWPEDPGT